MPVHRVETDLAVERHNSGHRQIGPQKLRRRQNGIIVAVRRARGPRRWALAQVGAPAAIVETLRGLGPDEFMFLGASPVRVDLLRASTAPSLRGL